MLLSQKLSCESYFEKIQNISKFESDFYAISRKRILISHVFKVQGSNGKVWADVRQSCGAGKKRVDVPPVSTEELVVLKNKKSKKEKHFLRCAYHGRPTWNRAED